MSTELTLLGWTMVLAIVQILLHSSLRTKETGVAYNASARDEAPPPPGKVTARLERAKQNLFETLPLFALGIPMVRSLVWLVSLAGLLMVVYAVLSHG